MNFLLDVSLILREDDSGLVIHSECAGFSDDLPIDRDELDLIRGQAVRELDSESLKRTMETLKRVVMTADAWAFLRAQAEHEANKGAGEASGKVRLCLTLSDKLGEVPWELAFVDGPFDRTVTVVRVRRPVEEDLAMRWPVRVGLIHAITGAEEVVSRGSLTELRNYLRGEKLGAKNPVAHAMADEVLEQVRKGTGGEERDLLHFTGHGGPNGGVMLFGRGAGVDTPAGEEVFAPEFGAFVRAWKAQVVVVAACGTTHTEGHWSFGALLAADPTVKAVVAMREPIEDADVADFCVTLYGLLLDKGKQLDTAVLEARRALPREARSIPQLYLNVTGDLRVWPKVEEQRIELDKDEPPSIVRPLPVLRAGGQLWQVACSRTGQLTSPFKVGPDSLVASHAHASVAMSPDGRGVAAITGNRFDFGWLVGSPLLRLARVFNSTGVDLPPNLCDRNADLLAIAVLHDARLRVLVATNEGTYWALCGWDESGLGRWDATVKIAADTASSAVDLLPHPILVVDGELNDLGSGVPVFEGPPWATMIDLAWSLGRRIAAAITVSGQVRLSIDNASLAWESLPNVSGGARGVAVVRQVETPIHRLEAASHRPEIVVVDAHGKIRAIELELPHADARTAR